MELTFCSTGRRFTVASTLPRSTLGMALDFTRAQSRTLQKSMPQRSYQPSLMTTTYSLAFYSGE